jgi:uncharacterized membrane protein
MSLSSREFWTVIHGLVLGAIYLIAFAGGFAGLWSLRKEFVTEAGVAERMGRLLGGVWTMTIVVWLTVIVGTYVVYPWYRAQAPNSPRSLLLADPMKAGWHSFGMEWKEHVAWLAPMLVTAVAAIVMHYGPRLSELPKVRKGALVLFILAFLAAAVAGVFGAFINKAAPIM